MSNIVTKMQIIFFFVILYFTGFTLQKWTAAQTIRVTSMEFVQMLAWNARVHRDSRVTCVLKVCNVGENCS